LDWSRIQRQKCRKIVLGYLAWKRRTIAGRQGSTFRNGNLTRKNEISKTRCRIWFWPRYLKWKQARYVWCWTNKSRFEPCSRATRNDIWTREARNNSCYGNIRYFAWLRTTRYKWSSWKTKSRTTTRPTGNKLWTRETGHNSRYALIRDFSWFRIKRYQSSLWTRLKSSSSINAWY